MSDPPFWRPNSRPAGDWRRRALIFGDEDSDEFVLAQRATAQMEAELTRIVNQTVGVFQLCQDTAERNTTYRLGVAPEYGPPLTRKQENHRRAELSLPPVTDEDIVHAAQWLPYLPAGIGNPVLAFSVLSSAGTTFFENNRLCDLCHHWWQAEGSNAVPDRKVLDILRAWQLLPGLIYGRGSIEKLRTFLQRVLDRPLHPFKIVDATEWGQADSAESNPNTAFYALEITAGNFPPPEMDVSPKQPSRLYNSDARDEGLDDMDA